MVKLWLIAASVMVVTAIQEVDAQPTAVERARDAMERARDAKERIKPVQDYLDWLEHITGSPPSRALQAIKRYLSVADWVLAAQAEGAALALAAAEVDRELQELTANKMRACADAGEGKVDACEIAVTRAHYIGGIRGVLDWNNPRSVVSRRIHDWTDLSEYFDWFDTLRNALAPAPSPAPTPTTTHDDSSESAAAGLAAALLREFVGVLLAPSTRSRGPSGSRPPAVGPTGPSSIGSGTYGRGSPPSGGNAPPGTISVPGDPNRGWR